MRIPFSPDPQLNPTGLKEMKRENSLGGRKIRKDEKKAVKKELIGLKKDLEAQMKQIRRERRGLK